MTLRLNVLAAAASLALAGTSAVAGMINFDTLSLADYGDISSTHADHGAGGEGDARVGVKYFGGVGCSAPTNHLDFWNNDYGSLTKVAFAPTNGCTARIELTADAGWLIDSLSFKLAGYFHSDLPARQVIAGIPGVDVDFGSPTILGSASGPGFSLFSVTNNAGGSSAYIQWGVNWNIGIDDIQFNLIADPGNSVPEPGTLALAGLASLLALSRRRRRG